MKCRFLFSAVVSGVLLCSPWLSQPVNSHPHQAQGFGAAVTGGFGYQNYYVTSTSSGPDTEVGSFRWALKQAALNGGGYIRFDPPGQPAVGGVINYSGLGLRLEIPSNVTISGETAADISGKPPGITIYGASILLGTATESSVTNIIVRHVRFRDAPAEFDYDCFEINTATGVLVQHCSMAWGRDGTLDIRKSSYVTVEYCIIAEAMDDDDHSLAMLVNNKPGTDGRITIHHNLFVSNRGRNPLMGWFGPYPNLVEVYNNVVYNWGTHGTHTTVDQTVRTNIVGNYYKPGPSTLPSGHPDGGRDTAIYVRTGSTAYAPSYPAVANGNQFLDGAKIKWDSQAVQSATSIAGLYETMESAESAKTNVLNFAGPEGVRDYTDYRLISEVNMGAGSIKSAPPQYEIDILTGVIPHPW